MAMYRDSKPRPAFHDHSWARAELHDWDHRWATLPRPTRLAFLAALTRAARHAGTATLDRQNALRALQAAGLIDDEKKPPPGAMSFASRLHTIQYCGLINREGNLRQYAQFAYLWYNLEQALAQVLEKATGMTLYSVPNNPLDLLVSGPYWPDWVADYLKEATAQPLLDAIHQAGNKVPLASVPGLLPGRSPDLVLRTLDQLVNYLALVEDIDRESGEIIVGLLPSVIRAKAARETKARIELKPVPPAQVALPDGHVVPDMTAMLVELSSMPARLKQSDEVYARDKERLIGILPPLPGWMNQDQETEPVYRLYHALACSHELQLVGVTQNRDETVVEVTPTGHAWLAMANEEKHAALFRDLNRVRPAEGWQAPSDKAFLGCDIWVVSRQGKERPTSAYHLARRFDPLPLRAELHKAFRRLELGKFYRLDEVVNALSRTDNPLLLGGPAKEVHVIQDGRVVLPLEEVQMETARNLISSLVEEKLGPMGCVQYGIDAKNQMLIARRPRLDAYFDPSVKVASAPESEVTRLLVQPDFTLILIGLSPTPAADLAPFCERDRASVTPGTITYRLTRESVMRGLQIGLTGVEMEARLKRHASNAIPKNVEAQLRTWAEQSCRVTVATMLVLTCQSSEAADRAQAVLGKKSKRLGPTHVGLEGQRLTPSLRQKLAAQGVLVTAS